MSTPPATRGEAPIPVLYRNSNGDWIMLGDKGEKFEVAMNGSPLERAMSYRLYAASERAPQDAIDEFRCALSTIAGIAKANGKNAIQEITCTALAGIERLKLIESSHHPICSGDLATQRAIDSPRWSEIDALCEGKSKIDLAEIILKEREARSATRTPVGWIQELADGRKCFYEGDLDPREIHDNGKPCYRVFK